MSASRTHWMVALLALGACTSDQKLEACNIATIECQEDVYYALLRLRGDGYDPLAEIPPILTLTRDEYRRMLEASLPDKAPEPEPMEPEPEPEAPPLVPWDFALQVLKLVTPTTSSGQASVDNQVNTVAAFYSSATRSVTVIDNGIDPNETPEHLANRLHGETSLLLHELVHALQDRELSGASFDGTTDGNLTARALTEGEATFYQRLAEQEMIGIDPADVNWDERYDAWLGQGRIDLGDASSPYYSVRWFIYPLGAHYLTDAWLRGGNAAVRHAYAYPRRFMSQFIAGYGEDSEPLDPALACAIEGPSASYKRVGYDRFGALLVYAFLRASKVPDEEAWPLVAGWGDDRIHVFFDEEAQVALVSWALRFDSDADAERAASLLVLDERVRAEVRGRDVIVIGGSDEDVTANWDGALGCEPSP